MNTRTRIALHTIAPYCLLGGGAILYFLLFWPGQMTPDSIGQFKEAQSGLFGDGHPPLMAFVWRWLMYIIPGPGAILTLHMILLFTACAIFIRAFITSALRWYYALLPLFPPILFYASMIWKDVGFAFSYLLVSGALAYYCMHSSTNKKEGPGMASSCAILLILFYGTAIKFQALFVLPPMLFGLAYIRNQYTFSLKTIIHGVSFCVIMIAAINTFNMWQVAPERVSNHWKFVKIYDLAGMSIVSDKQLLPDYITESSQFSMDEVRRRFNYERVDDIVFFPDSPIPRTETAKNRDELVSAWRKAVLTHPFAYFQHRWHNWSRLMCAKPLEKLETLDFGQFGGLRWLAQLQQASQQHDGSLSDYLGRILFGLLYLMRYTMSFLFVFCFMIAYTILAYWRRQHSLAPVLLIMCLTGLSLVVVLFGMCMASSLRYVYLAVCLTYAMHPIAYTLWRNKKIPPARIAPER